MPTLLFSMACAVSLAAQAVPSTGVDAALPNDNLVAAGRLVKGVLTLHLEARQVNWYPEEATGTVVKVFGFAEAGQRVRVPGPMIRVSAGTALHVTVRNRLSKPLRLRGLQDRSSAALDSVVIAPGATQDFRFRVDTPGTFYYWGRTEPLPPVPEPGVGPDALLTGAFIVDPVRTKPPKGERVFVIALWSDIVPALGMKSDRADRVLRRELVSRDRWLLGAVNGRSWPHTERLSYAVGDTVHWRIINASPAPHPMHLHGFYFDVDARGDGQRDTLFTSAQRRRSPSGWPGARRWP